LQESTPLCSFPSQGNGENEKEWCHPEISPSGRKERMQLPVDG